MPDWEWKLKALIGAELVKNNTHSVLLGIQSKDGQLDFIGAGERRPDEPVSVVRATSRDAFYNAKYERYAAHIDANRPYFIASVTKMYSTAIIMQLVDEGGVDLAAPIPTYLPAELIDGIHVYQGTDYSQQITVRQLVRQTSGLADYFMGKRVDGSSLLRDLKQNIDRAYSIDDVLAQVRKMTPRFPPDAHGGQRAAYSDTNYQLLGAIIEAVTDQPLAQAYQTRIFDRLGLVSTYLYDHHQKLRNGPQPLTVYHRDQALRLPLSMSSERGAGGIVSTVPESLRFLRAYFAGELFDAVHLPLMMQWNAMFFPIQYGAGLMRFKLPRWMTLFRDSPELIGHAGSTGSFAFYAPQKEIFVAGTFNQAAKPSRPFGFMLKALAAAR